MTPFKLQPWSDSITEDHFRVRFFFDTNLLIYLLDNKYQSLNDFIEVLNGPYSPFVELVSSRYVIFEFVGVRKKQHYQRIVIENLAKTPKRIDTLIDGFQNFRDSDKYYLHHEEFDDIKFKNVIADIKTKVEAELDKVINEFNIKYDFSSFHVDQLDPTFEICLSSKISNYDGLVLISSVLPTPNSVSHNVMFLTADTNLISFYDPEQIKDCLSKHSIPLPEVHNIASLKIAKAGIVKSEKKNKDVTNLKMTNKKEDIQETVKDMILRIIKTRLRSNYLGTTVEAKNLNIPKDIIFIKLVKNYPLVKKIEEITNPSSNKEIFMTVISKDLDFIYTTKKKVEAFWHKNSQITSGYKLPANKKDVIVSFSVKDEDDEKHEIPVEQPILDSIRAKDNLVFIHPDSLA
ncbi:MAG: hypothetical protein AUG51_21525 [Acidobacteria bacterium 13_1_20CM_3_53_8]|nr:MAG: hypothetical protein AUG51_21525 [Acidobacteria bacterium 13_1_20CM_3_53_8]